MCYDPSRCRTGAVHRGRAAQPDRPAGRADHRRLRRAAAHAGVGAPGVVYLHGRPDPGHQPGRDGGLYGGVLLWGGHGELGTGGDQKGPVRLHRGPGSDHRGGHLGLGQHPVLPHGCAAGPQARLNPHLHPDGQAGAAHQAHHGGLCGFCHPRRLYCGLRAGL